MVLTHLALSVTVAALVSIPVFLIWFPTHLRHITDALRLFLIMMGVDAICGPLLMLVLYQPTKTRRALMVDFSLIAAIQVSALAYGLNALVQVRPLAIVFEVDRFRVVSYADIAVADVKDLPSWAQPWSLKSPRMLSVKSATTPAERLENFDLALQGVDVGQRPKHWQNYEESRSQILKRSKPLNALYAARPEQLDVLSQAVTAALKNIQLGEVRDPDALRWLPLVSRTTLEWVVLIDPSSLRIRAYAPVDGFI